MAEGAPGFEFFVKSDDGGVERFDDRGLLPPYGAVAMTVDVPLQHREVLL